eukprot:gene4719-9363_t
MKNILLHFIIGYCFSHVESFSTATRAFSKCRLPLLAHYKEGGITETSEVLKGVDLSIIPLVLRISSLNAHHKTQQSEIERVENIRQGILSWRVALQAGRVPENSPWPPEPLISRLNTAVLDLDLPRLTYRHPELVPAAIRGILELAVKYYSQINTIDENEENPKIEEDNAFSWENVDDSESTVDMPFKEGGSTREEDIASSLVRQFVNQWAPPLGGLAILDEVFGSKHGLLAMTGQEDIGGGGGGGGGGFGLFDGIWKHQGWKQITSIQEQLRNMPELKDLVSSLGRRPSTRGDLLQKYPPQLSDLKSPPGVALSPRVPNEMKGLRRSDSLEGLLPSETMLLSISSRNKRKTSHSNNTSSTSSSTSTSISYDSLSKRLRLLFMARRVERSLSSYELMGWEDQRSTPRRPPWKYFPKLPTAIGGPIIVCLDTSWSMVGQREFLAKSVVLECTMMAMKQKRPCYVLAFSGRGNIAECDVSLSPDGADKGGLQRLLDFLGNSFNGGTDVTSPLIRAFDMLENTQEWAAADILLVTDGELSTPPVSDDVISTLRALEAERGLQVHGLLIGREDSQPLDVLCTSWDNENRIYNFLCKWDPVYMAKNARREESSDMTELLNFNDINKLNQDRNSNKLPSSFEASAVRSSSLPGKASPSPFSYNKGNNHGRVVSALHASNSDSIGTSEETRSIPQLLTYSSSLAIEMTQAACRQLAEAIYSPEKEEANRRKIQGSLLVLETDLVEREVEVRLVLLAALCREHILLLGPPGTGKSELGRRLASLSGGSFFERLLTRYTTPEELFGPLSLAALERDEYVRNTDGYLPTATVAFLDEIFKANSAILNSLLTILNERQFDNGNKRSTVPLLAVVAASNELPESEELDALYDRFLLRTIVKSVSDNAVGSTEFIESVIRDAAWVQVPVDVKELLQDLRIFLREGLTPPSPCSDRRLVKAVRMLCVMAASQARKRVSLLDCLILRHVFWTQPEDFEKISDWLWRRLAASGSSEGLQFLVINTMKSIVEQLSKADIGDSSLFERAETDLNDLSSVLVGRAADIRLNMMEFNGKVVDNKEHGSIWLCADDVIAVRQRLLPRAEKDLRKLETLLAGVLSLKTALVSEGDLESRSTLLSDIWDTFSGTNRDLLSGGAEGNYNTTEDVEEKSSEKDSKKNDKGKKSNKKRFKQGGDDDD